MTDNQTFGYMPDGQPVHLVTLRGGGLTARILTLGAIVQDLRLDGIAHPLVLGCDRLEPYLNKMQYFGAMVGRYANRIANGRFTLNGQTFDLSRNQAGTHCLHGGQIGSANRIWRIIAQTDSSVGLALRMADQEMGFPGALEVELTISLDQGALAFDLKAVCDQDTVCSFSHHGYFVLDNSGSLAHHHLQIAADHYLPVTNDLIPTGEVASVRDTPFDFRASRKLHNVALDHNFCLSHARTDLRPVAWLHSALSGLRTEVRTTEAGLQIYTANHLPQSGVTGHDGQPLARHAGIALEAQAWPDSPSQAHFPSAVLRAGDTYRQSTHYAFTRPPLPESA